MSVPLAAQTLSHSVAAGINMAVATNALPPEAAYTADFCEKMDQLFDSVNSRKRSIREMRSKPYKAAVTASTGHVNFWRENIKWLQSWKIDSSHIQCVQGWILTLTVLILLWSELQDRWNFEFLLVSRCNQDCLENLFSVVRQKGGSNDTPWADQFRNSLKAAVVDQLLRPEGKNCQFLEEDNNDSVFTDYLLECTKKSSDTPPSSHDHLPSSSVGPSSASPPPKSLEEENVWFMLLVIYVTGSYLSIGALATCRPWYEKRQH